MIPRTWMVVASCLLIACSPESFGLGGEGGNGGGGGGGGAGGGGGPASPCPNHQRDDAFGHCLDICLSENDCPPQTSCYEAVGLCLPDQQGTCFPAECDPGWVCPTDGVGPCVPGPGYCERDFDCDFSQRCEGGLCVSRAGDIVMTCSGNGECPVGMTCQIGVCVGCLSDVQCSAFQEDAQCYLGTCISRVIGPAAQCLTLRCPEGCPTCTPPEPPERCNPNTGLCEPTCIDNGDCLPGEICAPVINRCTIDPSCVTDEDCPGALTCATVLGSGLCQGCTDSEPCKTGLTCINGTCLPEPEGNPCDVVECPGTKACDALDGSCYPANGSCQDANDCRQGQNCNLAGLCSGCSVSGDCRSNQNCVLGICVPR